MARLAVIAGQGMLPVTLADQARRQGEDVVVFRIAGQADADFSAFDGDEVPLGAVGQTRDRLVEAGCDRVVMAGKIRRPSLAQLKPDAAAVKLLAKAVGRGDDALLRAISDYLADAGIETLSPDVFMPQAMMPDGLQAGQLDAAARVDVDRGVAVLDALGAHDVGQAVVVQDARVIAIEAAEGTDEMLRRVAALLDPSGPPAVFVKRRKAGQDTRLDLPVIGADTIRNAATAGIGVMALEAGGVLLAGESDSLWQLAGDKKMTVVGI